MFCNKNQFPSLPLCGPYTKQYGIIGLSNHYHMQFDAKLGHVICAIHHIPCACSKCTYIIDKSWIHGLKPQQQPLCQPVTYCTYWPVLGSFNNWNIITLTRKSTTTDVFEEIHQVILDVISDNISPLA